MFYSPVVIKYMLSLLGKILRKYLIYRMNFVGAGVLNMTSLILNVVVDGIWSLTLTV